MDKPWNCPPLNLFNWSNYWKWKKNMANKEEFLSSMRQLNELLNMADQCQPVMMKYLSEQDKPLLDMNELDFIGVWSNLSLILQPLVQNMASLMDTPVFKEIKDLPKAYVPGLILPA